MKAFVTLNDAWVKPPTVSGKFNICPVDSIKPRQIFFIQLSFPFQQHYELPSEAHVIPLQACVSSSSLFASVGHWSPDP